MLLPIVQKKLDEFKAKANSEGCDFLVTCTYRSPQVQDQLYAQGRTTPGAIVTNAKGGQSIHQYKCAFDMVPMVHGKAIWENDALWAKLGAIGQSVGLEWGGSWATINDRPHFQYTLGYSWQDFLAGKVDLTKFNLPHMENNSTASPISPAAEAGTTGNAVIFQVVNKTTGEVIPHTEQGSDSQQHQFVITASGETITFPNDTYELKAL